MMKTQEQLLGRVVSIRPEIVEGLPRRVWLMFGGDTKYLVGLKPALRYDLHQDDMITVREWFHQDNLDQQGMRQMNSIDKSTCDKMVQVTSNLQAAYADRSKMIDAYHTSIRASDGTNASRAVIRASLDLLDIHHEKIFQYKRQLTTLLEHI